MLPPSARPSQTIVPGPAFATGIVTVRIGAPPAAGVTTRRTAPASVIAWLTETVSAIPSPFGENWAAPVWTAPGAPIDGAVRSIVNVTDFVVSVRPVRSVERNETRWTPSPPTTTGPPYGARAAPSTAISLDATPLCASLGSSPTVTSSR